MKNLFNNFPVENGDRSDALNLVKVLQYIANVDGIDHTEKVGILSLISSRGWDPKLYTEALDSPISSISMLPYNSETIGVFSNYIIRDCIIVAHIEGGYSKDESNLISTIANELNVSKQTLTDIETAVDHHVNSVKIWSSLI